MHEEKPAGNEYADEFIVTISYGRKANKIRTTGDDQRLCVVK